MPKKTASEIVVSSGMSDRPGYYSGRGATQTDLNSSILERVYKKIISEYGEVAGQNFIQMVADIPKLSATDFLLTLYRLESSKLEWDPKLIGKEKGIYVNSEPVAFATVASALFGDSDRDETYWIRQEFLRKYGNKIKRK